MSELAGFRFAWTDVVAIVACGVATYLAWPIVNQLALLLPFVLAHFFLFCNVFRIRRSLELCWGATFLIVCAIWLCSGHFSLVNVALSQMLVTLIVIAIGVFQKDYHGVGYRRVPWGRRLGEDGDADVDRESVRRSVDLKSPD